MFDCRYFFELVPHVLLLQRFLEPSSHNMSGIGVEDGEESAQDNEILNILFDFHTGKHVINPPVIMETSIVNSTKDPDVATGSSHYLGIDKEMKEHDYCWPPEYIEGEEVVESSVKCVTSPLKSSNRAIKMVQMEGSMC